MAFAVEMKTPDDRCRECGGALHRDGHYEAPNVDGKMCSSACAWVALGRAGTSVGAIFMRGTVLSGAVQFRPIVVAK